MRIGLSATVARPSELRAYLLPQTDAKTMRLADLILVRSGAPHDIAILPTDAALPWAGYTTLYAVRNILDAIRAHKLSLLFVNTRSQAELLFQELWRCNDDDLPIALHHGSLDAARRRKVEAAMAAGTLRAVVSTSTLDLGVDWGNVDLVINVGAPKGASRLMQRVGRANHRLEEASRALPGAFKPLRGTRVSRRDRSRGGRSTRRLVASVGRARRARATRLGHGLQRPN